MKGTQGKPEPNLQHLLVYSNTFQIVIVTFLRLVWQMDEDVIWDLKMGPKCFEVFLFN